MGVYYRYVNFTRREFVGLSDLRDGGDKENAVVYCGPAIAWLIMPPRIGDDFRGRWAYARYTVQDIRVVSDGEHDFGEMDEDGFLNITPGLLQSFRMAWPEIAADYQPRIHDVQLSLRANGSSLLDAVSAACKCGWKVGPLYGQNRDATLVQIVSDHVNALRRPTAPREPKPFMYRPELSADDICDLIEALEHSNGGERLGCTERVKALRERLANVAGTR
jgi:hypothetical protein